MSVPDQNGLDGGMHHQHHQQMKHDQHGQQQQQQQQMYHQQQQHMQHIIGRTMNTITNTAAAIMISIRSRALY